MHPKLERDIREWLLKKSQAELSALLEYLKRVVSYNSSFEDFGFLANRIPNGKLYDSYYGLDKAHLAFSLTEDLFDDFFDNPKYSKYLELTDHNGFYLEGKPYIKEGVFRNVHSLPNRELIQILESDFSGEKKTRVVFNSKMYIAKAGSENIPIYKPRSDSEPYHILRCLLTQHLEKAQPLSGGALSKMIYGSITKANQISTSVDKMRRRFKTKLGHEFISNDSGYYINNDRFDVSLD